MGRGTSVKDINEVRAWRDRAEALEKAIEGMLKAIATGTLEDLDAASEKAREAVKEPLARW
jgi:hypothetical protein